MEYILSFSLINVTEHNGDALSNNYKLHGHFAMNRLVAKYDANYNGNEFNQR